MADDIIAKKPEMIYAVVDIQGHLLVVAAILEKQFKKSVFSTTLHYFDIFIETLNELIFTYLAAGVSQ